MYVAVSYIGSSIIPGEIIPDDTPSEKLEWWKGAGAIREIKSAPPPQEFQNDSKNVNDDPAKDAVDAVQDEDDFFETEPDAPEVDVASALVQGHADTEEADEPEQTKEKPKRKKGAKAK